MGGGGGGEFSLCIGWRGSESVGWCIGDNYIPPILPDTFIL